MAGNTLSEAHRQKLIVYVFDHGVAEAKAKFRLSDSQLADLTEGVPCHTSTVFASAVVLDNLRDTARDIPVAEGHQRFAAVSGQEPLAAGDQRIVNGPAIRLV